MSPKASFCLAVFAVLLVSSLGLEDPELEQCKHQCKVQQKFDEKQRKECVRGCEEYSRQKQERERGGSYGEEDRDRNPESPIERLRECMEGCDTQHGQERERCQSSCKQGYEREREKYQGRQEMEEGEGKQQYEENPYVFKDRHFVTGLRTQHGRLRILQKFTDRSKKLYRGIENYRLAIYEADPLTFVVPNYFDAEALIFVAKGKGTVSLVTKDRRESFNIKEGDILRIKAGTTAYLINRDQNERLVLAKLLQPVSTPGNFEAFFGVGGENPESFYSVFSNEILEAAFNVRRDRIEKLFGQQRQGAILKVSREQIQRMSQHEEGGIWPFGGGESKSTYNIYEQHPTHANQYGQLYEVDSSHFRSLHDLDVAVALTNITRGAMTALYYNSRATKICTVIDGAGYYEMACPHISQSQNHHEGSRWREGEWPGSRRESGGNPTYQKISSRLEHGTVVVVPAGHPFVAVASTNQNLQLICFLVHANDNEKHALTGKRNVINRLEREAKELSFGVPEREVDAVFRSQEEEFFSKGPRQQQRGFSDM
ncbi:sucrose-binding protein-like [Dorcoceras hygrometricum]|uniref:Sucrose-binding protein-like n=1 Tax=Dorcoceras hygrometricum TaxID=472368 RepID=A0A2Z7AT42_9LAMI|nr:sucrose-binding protein-like [Dorcoceras hygrometricum]